MAGGSEVVFLAPIDLCWLATDYTRCTYMVNISRSLANITSLYPVLSCLLDTSFSILNTRLTPVSLFSLLSFGLACAIYYP